MSPESLALLVLVAAVSLYALLGGADFGAGVWELLSGLRAGRRERALSYRAIGPVWEANHVWLIFALVVLWTAFPPAFAALCSALWAPLLLGLVGIVFRGGAYAFRAASVDHDERRRHEVVFACASTLAPLGLGAAAGALASGALPSGAAARPWTGFLGPTALFSAAFALALCAYLAAVYLTREAAAAAEPDLALLWRRRALASGVATGALALLGLLVVRLDAPRLWAGFEDRAWPLVLASGAGGLVSLVCTHRSRPGPAVLGAGLAVGAVVWGWGLAQYPDLVPPDLNVANSKAPPAVLWTMLGCVSAGALLLVPSLAWLLWLFKRAPLERGAPGALADAIGPDSGRASEAVVPGGPPA